MLTRIILGQRPGPEKADGYYLSKAGCFEISCLPVLEKLCCAVQNRYIASSKGDRSMHLQTLKTAAGSALALAATLGLQAPSALAGENPFEAVSSGGYSLAAADAPDKCGAAAKPPKGDCRMMGMDSNGDGQVSREEFIKGHEVMFDNMDSNHDGMLDADERSAHKRMMKQEMMGKCGQQKGTE
jgi:EF hand